MTEEQKAPTPEEIKQEDRKIRHLRQMVDFTSILIMTGCLKLPICHVVFKTRHCGVQTKYASCLVS